MALPAALGGSLGVSGLATVPVTPLGISVRLLSRLDDVTTRIVRREGTIWKRHDVHALCTFCHTAPVRLDVDYLRTFLTVLDAGTMTRAAAELNVSQSAVSIRMRRLETRVGAELVVRTGQVIVATPTGEELVPYARTLVTTHDAAVARLTSSTLAGTVRVGAGEERFAEQISPILGQFRHAHPRSTVIFHIGENARVLEQMLNNGELDLILTLVPSSEVRSTDHVLWEDDFIWIIGDGTYIETDHIALITFNKGSLTRQFAEATLKNAGCEFTTVYSGASIESVVSAVRAGIGVALINRRSAPIDSTEWLRAPEFPCSERVSYMLRLGPREPSILTSELAAEIRGELAEPI